MGEGINTGTIYYTVEADTAKLLKSSDSVDGSLDKLNATFGKTDKAAAVAEFRMNKTAAAVRDVNREAVGASSSLGGLQKMLAGVLTAQGITSLVQMAEQYNEMAERVQMATASQAEYEMVQQRLLNTANGTYRALGEAQELYIRTSDSLRSMGYSTSEALDITDSLSYSFVRNATSVDRAQNAIAAYAKSINKGRVEADAWESIIAATPTIINDLAAATGKSAAEIRELGASGKITAAQLNEGLRRALDDNKKAADGMAVTMRDAFTSLRNNLAAYLGEANKATGVTSVMAAAIKGLGDNIEGLATALIITGSGALAAYVVSLGKSAIASAQAALAARAQAAEELRLAQAHLAATAAAVTHARAQVGLTVTSTQAAAAENAHAAAIVRATMAQQAASGIAARMLGFLGGPVGLIAMLAASGLAMASFGIEAEAATPSIDRAEKAMSRMDIVSAKLAKNLDDAKKGFLGLSTKEAQSEVARLEKSVAGLQQRIESDKKRRSGFSIGYFEELNLQLKNEQEKLNALKDVLGKTQTDDADKYLDRLREQGLMIGKNTELEKARALLDSGRLVASKEQAAAILNKAAANDRETESIRNKEEALKVEKDLQKAIADQAAFTASIQDQVAARRRKVDQDMFGMGMGDRARQQANELLAIHEEYNRKREELARAQGTTNGLSPEHYAARLDALRTAQAQEIQIVSDGQRQMDEIRREGSAGISQAWNNYLENARDVSGQMESLFSNAFAGAEDALVDFVKTGKLDLRSLGDAILTDVIRMIIRMGIEMLATALISKAVSATAAAAYVAQVSGQAEAQTALAAQAAYASTAAIPVVGPLLAPAAALKAGAAAGSLGVAAVIGATSSLAGGRQYGGPVKAGGMYRINENGAPEVFNAANGQQFMLPNRRGEVVSNKDASGSSSSAPSVVINIDNTSSNSQVTATQGKGSNGQDVVSVVISDIESDGPISGTLQRRFGMRRKGS